jgi:hypothetical protein
MIATQFIITSPHMSYPYMTDLLYKNNAYQDACDFFQKLINDGYIINYVNQTIIDDSAFFTYWSVSKEKAAEFLTVMQDRSIAKSPVVVFENNGDTVTFAQPDLNYDNNLVDFDIGTELVSEVMEDGSRFFMAERFFQS